MRIAPRLPAALGHRPADWLPSPGVATALPTATDVVVVGAGLAGLRAAGDLAAAGAEVVVCEARPRAGGRTWSRSDGFADGQHVELGAEFVDATHTEVLALVEQLGHRLVPATAGHDPARRLVDHGGRLASLAAVDAATDGTVSADLDRWDAVLHRLAELVPDPDDPLSSPFAGELDRRTVAEVLADEGLSPLARLLVGRELRTEFMVPPAELSLLHLAWMSARHVEAGRGREAWRLRGGLQQLADGLAGGLGERIHYGCPVHAVDQTAGGPEVTTGAGRIRARWCVLAVPAPVLARIDVAPVLPRPVVDIGWGRGGKAGVQVARRLWLDRGCDGSVVSDRPYGELWETSVGLPGDHGVLTALLSSHDGAALLALPDALARVRAEMARVFPGLAGFAGRSVIHDWDNDPWALGTYAAYAPGQLTASWPQLRRPHGRIVLAGEHTDGFAGFMEGALRSGGRAARTITSSG